MKFQLGTLLYTQNINQAIKDDGNFVREITDCLNSYINLDWGDLGTEDCELNNQALIDDERIFAAYTTTHGKIYIITECDRSYTTVLFPNEY